MEECNIYIYIYIFSITKIITSKVRMSINGFLLNVVLVKTPITNPSFATICNMSFSVIQSYLYLEDL